MKFANLHLHTIYSDGAQTPDQIFEKAKEQGFGALAITDHNTVTGWRAFSEAAKNHGMDCILGMEANGIMGNSNLHFVCFDFDETDNKVAEYLKYHHEIMYVNSKAKFDSLVKHNYINGITWQDVLDDCKEPMWMCNEQIFASLVKRTEMTQADYRQYFLAFRAAPVEQSARIVYSDAEDIIKIIRNAGGVIGLAHPHCITKYLPELYEMGMNAVEYDHPDIDQKDIEEILAFAKGKKIYMAGGTDHTGMLSNFPLERETDPEDRDPCFLVPLSTDVRNGVTKEEYLALKNRIYG
ncbi:MAG: PHP domain-containing protein [Clostridia bacterium]|nr:PHP domain-containing protein [Clostridia bacterium]